MGQLYQFTQETDELLSEAERAFDLSVRQKSFQANQTPLQSSETAGRAANPATRGILSSIPWVGHRLQG